MLNILHSLLPFLENFREVRKRSFQTFPRNTPYSFQLLSEHSRGNKCSILGAHDGANSKGGETLTIPLPDLHLCSES